MLQIIQFLWNIVLLCCRFGKIENIVLCFCDSCRMLVRLFCSFYLLSASRDQLVKASRAGCFQFKVKGEISLKPPMVK